MKKFNTTAILVILLLLCTVYIMYGILTSNKKNDPPKIDMTLKVSYLTDDEYSTVGTVELENPQKDDFRIIDFTLNVSHSDKIDYRKIIVPNLEEISNSYDIKRYWTGNSFRQDNASENFATYTYNFVFYSKGLNDQQIKDIFSKGNITLSFANNFIEDELNLGNYMQFE